MEPMGISNEMMIAMRVQRMRRKNSGNKSMLIDPPITSFTDVSEKGHDFAGDPGKHAGKVNVVQGAFGD